MKQFVVLFRWVVVMARSIILQGQEPSEVLTSKIKGKMAAVKICQGLCLKHKDLKIVSLPLQIFTDFDRG
jgi:hypothetical protein